MKDRCEVPPSPRKRGRASLGLAWLGLLAAGSIGCNPGPAFQASQLPKPPANAPYGPVPTPAATVAAPVPLGAAQTLSTGGPVPEAWWTGFGSPELNSRIQQAFRNSPTVAAARAALTRAQENLRAANGGRMPAVTFQAGVTRENTNNGVVVSPFTLYNASVNVSYNLDLFGAVRRGVEFQQALADQQQWQLRGTYLALAANVATASIQEASLRAQMREVEATLGLLREQEGITRSQVAVGAKGQADLLLAQANLAAEQAQLPGLRLQLETLRNQLYVYLGRFPGEGGLDDLDLDAFTLPGEVPVSLPSELVRQRPDVQAAEAQVHAATAQLGQASANLFPSLTLSGSYGPQAMNAGDLLKSDLMVWNAGLNLLQPIFNGGSLRAQKRAAAAGLDQAVAGYRATVLGAFGNVADALDALERDAEALQARAEAERAAAQSLDLVQAQYRLGAVSYPQLLDATRLWQGARIGLIQAQSARLADTTALYAALGGGWTPASTVATHP
jgi:NodT family efflux transporter outer membrane factor (OMF) lipoprotein